MICKECKGTGIVEAEFESKFVPYFSNPYKSANKKYSVQCRNCSGTGKLSKIKEVIKLIKER